MFHYSRYYIPNLYDVILADRDQKRAKTLAEIFSASINRRTWLISHAQENKLKKMKVKRIYSVWKALKNGFAIID